MYGAGNQVFDRAGRLPAFAGAVTLLSEGCAMPKKPSPKLLRLTRCEREALKVARQILWQKGGCITGGGWDRHCERIDALLKRA